ncbi:MAG: hypothetical protein JWR26_1652 [Pedosphaera sp.]|nr:hypothetical protein [Pedosphaera sp.]
MKYFSRFSLSLIAQFLLILFTMFIPMLHEEEIWGPIRFIITCTAWNLLLILDWLTCKAGLWQRDAVMHTLPAPIQMLLPLIFLAFQLNWGWILGQIPS